MCRLLNLLSYKVCLQTSKCGGWRHHLYLHFFINHKTKISYSCTKVGYSLAPYIQSPRYDSLKSLLSSHLRHFLTLTPSQATPTSQDEAIEPKHDVMWRMCELERYLAASPRNIEDKKQLLECGYSSRLWEEVRVKVLANTICTSA